MKLPEVKQRGEAKAVGEQTPETQALLKVLALTGNAVDEGKVRPAAAAFAGIR
ncbi:MAG: antitoxin, Phd family protein, partial [Alphaproteobacteria bacterium]|nr:antitoxin, Phd family protein [Alphaproteobacteria bacterium]